MKKNDPAGVRGFSFAARAAAIKKPGKLDVALIYSTSPARCAGVFTTNKVVAAPVVVTVPRIRKGHCQAIVINSGNANACTGGQGLLDAVRCGEITAKALGIDEDLVAVSSTGVIGASLPMEKFEEHLPRLATELASDALEKVAEAIMTTDSFQKVSKVDLSAGGRDYTICGIAKGAGMIHPNMATMLAFVMTDALVDQDLLDTALRKSVDDSFNSITVDGDTSTNDMVLLLANGLAENREIRSGTPEGDAFAQGLRQVLLDLAKMIVRDGEGATKLVEIRVKGASNADDAKLAAKSIATSNLVKTAFFGEDANWGRIIAAVGHSGADVDPDRVDIFFNDVAMVVDGLGAGKEHEELATKVLKTPEFTVTVDLKLGDGEAVYYTSDLTYDYVRINADYRT